MARPPFDPKHVKIRPGQRLGADRFAFLTVTQLTHMVKRAIEQHLPGTLHVVGEISNFKRHTSGHLYFVLKDDHCELSCVMWRSGAASLKFDPADGLEVLATGQVDVFERSGRYQLYVRRLEPRGVGALELAFRQLREKLEKEGLFDSKHKKPLPRYPERIAVVTSPTGAAIVDILQTFARRYPCVHVYIYPVTVQGPTAAGEIAGAIGTLNARQSSLGGIDIMIVGRGGGSLEDLWAFNEEQVARAIFASKIPIISAVGHEIDVSISDLVADIRAATPTAAAELAVPVRDELLASLDDTARRLTRMAGHTVALRRAALEALTQRRPLREPMTLVQRREQEVDELATRLQRSVAERLHRWHRKLSLCEITLQGIRPDVFAARMQRRVVEASHRLRWALSRRTVSCERRLAVGIEHLVATAPAHRVVRIRDYVTQLAERLDAANHKNTFRRGQGLDELVARLCRGVTERLHRWHRSLSTCEVTLQHICPDVFAARMQRRVAEASHRLQWALSRRTVRYERSLAAGMERLAAVAPAHRIVRTKDHVMQLAQRLEAMSHKSTLRRGFTITRTKKRRKVIRDPHQLHDGDHIITDTAHGTFESRVVNLKQLELFD